MNRHAAQRTTAAAASSDLRPRDLVLQRTCACGNHIVAGGQCAECGRKDGGRHGQATGRGATPVTLSNAGIDAARRTRGLGANGDPLEREADAVALRGTSAPADEQGIRRHVGGTLGFDFSAVRIHREAAELDSDGTHALANGADIHVGPGRYRPDLPLGRALLAHELTHVAQQRAVPHLPRRSGDFGEALRAAADERSSRHLAASAATIADPRIDVSQAPRGMQQRCSAGCKGSSDKDEKEAGSKAADAGATPNASALPTPSHAAGPAAAAAGNKIVRLAWTVDDGPTPYTPGMSATVSPRAATWFVMSNQLGSGSGRTAAIKTLVTRQKAGDEVGIHSMHPTVGHSAWFPINLGKDVPKGYTKTADAMKDLKDFTAELRGGPLNVRFARMPGGELSEVKKYVETAGVTTNSEGIAQALLTGTTPPAPAPAAVATDVALVMSTLKTLGLHLWGGSASGPEITRTSWEAESSGVPGRNNDVVKRFEGVVNALASGKRSTPASLIILAHDTTKPDVAQADTNIKAMETYATAKGVRVEYYSVSDLYTIIRGTTP